MNENLKTLHCSDCAKSGISCNCNSMPSVCGKFIHATSNEMREYIRYKVMDIMHQVGVEEDKINTVSKMDIRCF